MEVKMSILEKLENNRGKYVSGENLAHDLGVSRQAVSKAVNALKTEGFIIHAVPNRGYMMPAEFDVLSAKRISECTGTRVFLFDCVKSTNEEAARLYLENGECIVVSRAQSDGKRKDGGKFPSPLDRGIYCSIALPLDLPLGKLVEFRKKCGNIVADTIARSSGQTAVCRRYDEVYIENDKVAGMLIECAVNAATERTSAAIIGIGIYFYTNGSPSPLPVFPDETRNNMLCEIYLKLKNAINNF